VVLDFANGGDEHGCDKSYPADPENDAEDVDDSGEDVVVEVQGGTVSLELRPFDVVSEIRVFLYLSNIAFLMSTLSSY